MYCTCLILLQKRVCVSFGNLPSLIPGCHVMETAVDT